MILRSRLTCVSGAPLPEEFSSEERGLLLRLAHQAISATLEQREISLVPPSPHLAEPRGAFTTLYYRGDLRGCVGYVFPVTSLYRTVAESARGAAFDDSRFPPVTRDQAPGTASLSQRALAAASDSAGTSGNWTPRPADQPGPLSRPVAAASAARARMGPHRLPRTNLQESRLAAKRVANGCEAGSLHRRSLRRPGVISEKCHPERGGSSACGRSRRVEGPLWRIEKSRYWNFLLLTALRMPQVTRWVFRV